ncbi:MAG: hypothetical protein RL538_671 [Candidatus Parcubacteria bacterium]|jgi:hypothetical protein
MVRKGYPPSNAPRAGVGTTVSVPTPKPRISSPHPSMLGIFTYVGKRYLQLWKEMIDSQMSVTLTAILDLFFAARRPRIGEPYHSSLGGRCA